MDLQVPFQYQVLAVVALLFGAVSLFVFFSRRFSRRREKRARIERVCRLFNTELMHVFNDVKQKNVSLSPCAPPPVADVV